MEDGVVVVAVEAVLEEVAGGERGLFGEEFEREVAECGLEDHFGSGLGLGTIVSVDLTQNVRIRERVSLLRDCIHSPS